MAILKGRTLAGLVEGASNEQGFGSWRPGVNAGPPGK